MSMRAGLLVLIAIVAAACGGAVPGGATQQPGSTQAPGVTAAPGSTPAGNGGVPGTSTCGLITPAELAAIWGGTWTAMPDTDGACTWTGNGNVSTRLEATDLTTAKALLGSAADVTVAGNPGVIGTLFGVIVYVQKGAVDLVVQTVLTQDTPEIRGKVVATAEKMLSRMP